MSSYLQALLAVPFRYSAADRAFYKKGQLKWTWNKLWCPKKKPESLKNYLCQSCLGLSARWRIFQFWLTGALPQYYQKVFKYNIIVIFLFMDLTLYNEEIDVHLRNRCSSVSILFHTILELPISSPRVFSKLLWCCLHKKPHQLGTAEVTAQHIDQYYLIHVLMYSSGVSVSSCCLTLYIHCKHHGKESSYYSFIHYLVKVSSGSWPRSGDSANNSILQEKAWRCITKQNVSETGNYFGHIFKAHKLVRPWFFQIIQALCLLPKMTFLLELLSPNSYYWLFTSAQN